MGANYENILALGKRIGLSLNISLEYSSFALSNSFWCRCVALMPLVECSFLYEEFPKEPLSQDGTMSHALERIYPYIAQSQGYYTATIRNEKYASTEITSLYNTVEVLLKKIQDKNVVVNYESLKNEELLQFCGKYQKICIWNRNVWQTCSRGSL